MQGDQKSVFSIAVTCGFTTGPPSKPWLSRASTNFSKKSQLTGSPSSWTPVWVTFLCFIFRVEFVVVVTFSINQTRSTLNSRQNPITPSRLKYCEEHVYLRTRAACPNICKLSVLVTYGWCYMCVFVIGDLPLLMLVNWLPQIYLIKKSFCTADKIAHLSPCDKPYVVVPLCWKTNDNLKQVSWLIDPKAL